MRILSVFCIILIDNATSGFVDISDILRNITKHFLRKTIEKNDFIQEVSKIIGFGMLAHTDWLDVHSSITESVETPTFSE